MREEIIFRMKSPFRDEFQIRGFHFGSGDKTVAIVGAMRGDEVQQMFVCSQLIKNLRQLEVEGKISPEHGILVIPTANPYSLNIQKRFWAMDNTDKNHMIPGFDKSETTQRIAASVIECVRDYDYGVQLASYYLGGSFVPHVRIMNTGYQDTATARSFALPFVYEYDPSPFDTTVLNYNWQIFGTHAFSVYSGSTDVIRKDAAKMTWTAILRFLDHLKIIQKPMHGGSNSYVFKPKDLSTIISATSGMLYSVCEVGQEVKRGDLMAKILDPCTGEVRSEIEAPASGTIFFAHQKALIHQHSRVYQILGY